MISTVEKHSQLTPTSYISLISISEGKISLQNSQIRYTLNQIELSAFAAMELTFVCVLRATMLFMFANCINNAQIDIFWHIVCLVPPRKNAWYFYNCNEINK